jgi:hypothetical protein
MAFLVVQHEQLPQQSPSVQQEQVPTALGLGAFFATAAVRAASIRSTAAETLGSMAAVSQQYSQLQSFHIIVSVHIHLQQSRGPQRTPVTPAAAAARLQ